MINLNTFTLFFSWKCNFSCSHCGFSCNPARNEVMALESALSYIEMLRGYNDLRMIAYSGGEPFLFYPHLTEAMSLANQFGLDGGVVTNCYWATSPQVAGKRIKELKRLGLDEIIASLDDFHLKYVPLDNIRNLVHAALRNNVRVGINVLSMKNSSIRKDSVPSMLGISPDIALDPEVLWIRESSPVPVGRAGSGIKRRDISTYRAEVFENEGCFYVGRNMIVTPDSSVYACCGFGDATSNGPASIAYAGNLLERSFDTIFDSVTRNLALNIISASGPYTLLKMAEEADGNVRFRKRYVSNCEICGEISTNRLLRKAVGSALRELAGTASAY